MSSLLKNLWNDDCGALISAEFLFVATILVIGIIVGLVAVRNAIVAELDELANAFLALSQSFSFAGLSGCCSIVEGSQAIDIPGPPIQAFCVANAIPQIVEDLPCD